MSFIITGLKYTHFGSIKYNINLGAETLRVYFLNKWFLGKPFYIKHYCIVSLFCWVVTKLWFLENMLGSIFLPNRAWTPQVSFIFMVRCHEAKWCKGSKTFSNIPREHTQDPPTNSLWRNSFIWCLGYAPFGVFVGVLLEGFVFLLDWPTRIYL